MATDTPTENTQSTTQEASLGQIVGGGMGAATPVVMINGQIFRDKMIQEVELSSDEWIPTCFITLETNNNMFLTQQFPRDGDLVNIYIRSMNDAFKPIRNDYLITSIETSKSKDKEGNFLKFYISGILHVPLLYAEVCKAYRQLTSFETLTEICKELKLGLVSNEIKTDDKMTWINSWLTYESFIRHVVKYAYKTTDSFFDSWIDHYYNLNFMDINKMLSVDDKEVPKEGMYKISMETDYNKESSLNHFKASNILTNADESKNSPFYVDSVELDNNSGKISLMNGYSRNIYFYEKALKKLVTFKVEALQTEEANKSKIILKGRAGENFYKDQSKSKWLGWQYALPDHNVHAHFREAELHNLQNLEDLKKINITAHLPNLNFNIYKGQKIPFYFVLSNLPAGEKAGAMLSNFLSGNYTIIGVTYRYTPDKKYEEILKLTKREWGAPNTTIGG